MSVRQAAAGFLKRLQLSSQSVAATCCRQAAKPLTSRRSSGLKIFHQNGSKGYSWGRHFKDFRLWVVIYGQAIILGINANSVLAQDISNELRSENVTGGADKTGLRRIEDGSVISNLHTSKWRVFTDNARDLFLQGRLVEAEKYFLSALQEAKEGFGERDPHVASACNNLAELYRVQKVFEKAEPLYLEAINILESSFGPDDIRVGTAFHNLGQFYVGQRKLEEALSCYEIKAHVLGYGHIDYADTMYHLGVVVYLLGNEKDSDALIQDSIRILEEAGQGESITCVKRLSYLAKVYLKSHRSVEAEKVQRKILHIVELSKGWNSLETVIAAENLALTLQSVGSLREAQELLERCLHARKSLLPEDHIQIGANMLSLARVAMLNINLLRNVDISKATTETYRAKDLLQHSIRIAQGVLDRFVKHKDNKQNPVAYGRSGRDPHAALVILMESLDALGLLELTMQELHESMDDSQKEAENALRQCISAFKKFGVETSVFDSPQVKAKYLSCLKHFLSLVSESTDSSTLQSGKAIVQELKDEINYIEVELSSNMRHKT
ncbi:uncharacterized protein LOC131160474 isoform X2 [Malania oleifera]|uniref:uncharacterized protein LOC131160474 isoform X2 n=1 Tax=Malania oleifera TaxID=397392 RepID=UPI0025AE17CC|nr:uncharacterized protein LOC131160474 isoform X2 [Malania oleifera]